MEDGSFNKSKNNIIICTDSYSKSEVESLINILDDKFNLSCGLVNTNKDQYRIRINKSSMPQLILAVKPYFVPSMLYKLGINTD